MSRAAFTVVGGPVVWLPFAHIDTDQIIPARFLKQPRTLGYGQYLFHDLRRVGDTSIGQALAGPEVAKAVILAAGANFGCGSSREAAVYALLDAGVRCVIAPSFGDIFRINCMKNGLLPAALCAEAISRLLADYSSPGSVSAVVDLQEEVVRCATIAERFRIEPFWRECLLLGVDEIDLTMRRKTEIDGYVQSRLAREPWLCPSTSPVGACDPEAPEQLPTTPAFRNGTRADSENR